MAKKKKIREFNTGATRDTAEDKFCYEGFLSPLVVKAFGAYMHKHRKQSNGELREPDNWQKGFGNTEDDVKGHCNTCIDSLYRHFMDLWLIHRGYEKESRESIDDAICGIMFNIMAYYHKLLEERTKKSEKENG